MQFLDGNDHNLFPAHRKHAIITELTSGRWTIQATSSGKGTGPIVLAASKYSGLDLPSTLAPAILAARAAAAKQPFASADAIAFALQPHIMDSVVRFAISEGRDIM